jgi:hypothetical protein
VLRYKRLVDLSVLVYTRIYELGRSSIKQTISVLHSFVSRKLTCIGHRITRDDYTDILRSVFARYDIVHQTYITRLCLFIFLFGDISLQEPQD